MKSSGVKLHVVVDEDLSPKVADLLNLCMGETVEAIRMPKELRGTEDTKWMAAIATRDPKPVVLTADKRILTRKLERDAVEANRLSLVVVAPSWMNLKWRFQCWRLLKAWPRVEDKLDDATEPVLVWIDVVRETVRLVK